MPTKKKPTKKSSNKLKFANVTGSKKALLITIFAAIVVGAGFVIRSFAETSANYFNASNRQFTIVSDSKFAGYKTETTSTKAGTDVLWMYSGGKVRVKPVNIPSGQSYRACVTARLTNSVSYQVKVANYANIIEINPRDATPDSYKQYCSDTVMNPSGMENGFAEVSAFGGECTITQPRHCSPLYSLISTLEISLQSTAK